MFGTRIGTCRWVARRTSIEKCCRCVCRTRVLTKSMKRIISSIIVTMMTATSHCLAEKIFSGLARTQGHRYKTCTPLSSDRFAIVSMEKKRLSRCPAVCYGYRKLQLLCARRSHIDIDQQ